MQIAIQDIRKLGFKKISQNFYSSEQGKLAFLERLRIENMMLSEYKASAFSFPKMYNKAYKNIKLCYFGIIKFMDMCEPMMRSIDSPDSSVQRKFRNQWNSMWKAVRKDLDLSEESMVMLKNLGIRIALVSDDYIVSSETYAFYNVILSWYVYTMSESTIIGLGLSPLRLLEILVVSDAYEFIEGIYQAALGGSLC